jgi:hypothetical protein
MMILAGCGDNKLPSSEKTLLTLEQWEVLPTNIKYEIDTLERLKEGNPQLMEQREWDKFLKTVLLPGKKKDFPNTKK